MREREKQDTAGLFKYCPKPVAPSSALYNPHVYKYISHSQKAKGKEEVRIAGENKREILEMP